MLRPGDRIQLGPDGNREVAERLGLRDRTVESHLDHIYAQLQLGSRSALTRVIVEAGLLP